MRHVDNYLLEYGVLMEPDASVALDMADFIARAPSPFHVTAEITRRLTAAGFSTAPGAAKSEAGRGYVVRDGTVIAWSAPGTVTEATPVARRAMGPMSATAGGTTTRRRPMRSTAGHLRATATTGHPATDQDLAVPAVR